MIKKIKYILITFLSSFVFALITLLLGKNYINILATTIDNTLGSYSIQLDIDNYNYNSKNLFNIYDYKIISSNNNSSIGFSVDNLVIGETYTFSSNLPIYWFKISDIPGGFNSVQREGLTHRFTFIMAKNPDIPLTKKQYLFIGINPNNIYDPIDNIYELNGYEIQIEKGNQVTDYIPFFKFGYNVDFAFNYTLSSYVSNVTLDIKLNNNTCFNKVVTLLQDSSYVRLKNVCFIPFNIENNGYFSLEQTSLSVNVTGDNITSINWQSGFILSPILNGYYKNEYVENILYLKNSYLSNSLFYNGFTANVQGNTITSPDSDFPSLFIMQNNTLSGVYRLSNTNRSYNLIGQKVDNVSYINSIDLNDSLNFTIGFDFGNNETLSSINNLIYNFSFSGINSIVIGNDSSTSPLPGNSSTINKYNTCSAWYDIPCQLGNALTYVVYEAPIISPILTFVVSFITMFSNLVSFVELFKGFGIVFGCFIIYMFINMLRKYSK